MDFRRVSSFDLKALSRELRNLGFRKHSRKFRLRSRQARTHALVLLDQAGWHVSKKLPVPDNITLLPMPPKSPELNPSGEHLAVHA
jgi:hypothetical protein